MDVVVPSEQLNPDLVTVVVPARNEEAFIEQCLESILAQDEQRLQVVVADGYSEDATRALVRAVAARDERVELVDNPGRIVPTGLNRALAVARGAWLVRVDAHATVPPDYVRRAVEHLRSGRWGGVGGRKDGVGLTAAGQAVAAAMESRFGVGNSVYHHGTQPQTVDHIPFGSYPTALVRALGGWDESLVVNQDYEFDYRVRQAGHELLFDPALRIEWHCRQSVRDLFRQYRRYGEGKTKVLAKHPRSASPRHLAAPGLVAAWAVAAALLPRRPRVGTALLAPYATAVAVASFATARRVPPRARPFVPGAFLAMHLGWGLGFWQGLVRLWLQRRRWPDGTGGRSGWQRVGRGRPR